MLSPLKHHYEWVSRVRPLRSVSGSDIASKRLFARKRCLTTNAEFSTDIEKLDIRLKFPNRDKDSPLLLNFIFVGPLGRVYLIETNYLTTKPQ